MDRFSPPGVHGGGRLCGGLFASLLTSMAFAGQCIQHDPFRLLIILDHTCLCQAKFTSY